MYDTINLWLPFDEVEQVNTSAIEQRLEHITVHEKDQNYSISGKLNGVYQIRLSDQGVSLKGSLAKYFLSDNFNTLTRADSQRAIERLSDELVLPLNKAKVRRLDFSTSFIMKHPPEAYYSYLGQSQYYDRAPFKKSLYYTNQQRQKLFYNKIAEGLKKGHSIPEVWEGKNVLRYELRYTRRLKDQLKENELTADKLYNPSFYQKIFNNWHKEYTVIDKINKFKNMNTEEINSPKDYMKQLQILAVNLLGQDEIMKNIEDLRLLGVFDKPEYYSRLKGDIRKLCNTEEVSEESELIQELNKKINNTMRYCR